MSKHIQYQLHDDDQLYFLHIQKTAGTTLYFTLDEKFDPDAICPARFWRQLLKIAKNSPDRFQQYRFFRGHFGYSIHKFIGKPPVHITVLRDPIERAVSHYEHIRREPRDRLHKIVTAHNMSFKDFIVHPETQLAITNLQTRSIAFDLGLEEIKQLDRFPARGILGTAPDISDDDLLQIAKDRLDQFAFIGLAERFQDSLLLLSYIFGWYPLVQSRELNKAPKKLRQDDLSPEIIDAVLTLNQLDSQLYAHAQTIFQEHMYTMLEDLQTRFDRPIHADLETLSTQTEPLDLGVLIPLLEKHYEQRWIESNPTPRQSVDFAFNRAISGIGWHLREGAGSGWHLQDGLDTGGTPFRWSGPSPVSTLDFPLSSQDDLMIRLRIINAAAPDILDSLALEVNGYSVELEPILKRGTLAVLQSVIPKAVLERSALTRFRFSVNRTVRLDPSQDDARKVGLAFHRVQIFPVYAQPTTEEYAHYQFPGDDPNWVEVARFIEHYLQPYDKVVAPTEFIKRFPNHYRSHLMPFANKTGLRWVVVHKGLMDEIDPPSLRWVMQSLRPVFANSVFVVFSNQGDLPSIPKTSPYLMALIVKFKLLDLERQNLLPNRVSVQLLHFLKAAYKVAKSLRRRSP